MYSYVKIKFNFIQYILKINIWDYKNIINLKNKIYILNYFYIKLILKLYFSSNI